MTTKLTPTEKAQEELSWERANNERDALALATKIAEALERAAVEVRQKLAIHTDGKNLAVRLCGGLDNPARWANQYLEEMAKLAADSERIKYAQGLLDRATKES